MKSLVVYDSRHGFTERCMNLLAEAASSPLELWSLAARKNTPKWDDYDAVALGGPVYFGHWSTRLTTFAARHADTISRRPRIAAFVTSLSPRAAALRYFSAGIPASFKGKLGKVAVFGGGVTWDELSWWERAYLKWHRGFETDASNLNLNEIHALADWLCAKFDTP